MKKLIPILIFILAFAGWAYAAKLISDPHPDETVSLYDLQSRPKPTVAEPDPEWIDILIDAPLEADRSILYELTSDMPDTEFRARAKGVWEEKSRWSDPYLSPSIPDSWSNIRLEP